MLKALLIAAGLLLTTGPCYRLDPVMHGTVLAKNKRVYTMSFKRGHPAWVSAEGDGDIDLAVYDESGRYLIAGNLEDDRVPIVLWEPRYTGKFQIVVLNAETRPVKFSLTSRNRIDRPLVVENSARWPSGEAPVCKTGGRGFKSRPGVYGKG